MLDEDIVGGNLDDDVFGYFKKVLKTLHSSADSSRKAMHVIDHDCHEDASDGCQVCTRDLEFMRFIDDLGEVVKKHE